MAYTKQVDVLEPIDLSEHLDKVELYLGQVCRLAGISKMQLDYWTNKAQIPTKGKKQRIYDMDAVETVMLIKQGKDKGLNLGAAIDAARRFREQQAARPPPTARSGGSLWRRGAGVVGPRRVELRQQPREDVDRRREDDRRRVRRADLDQRLQVAELQRDRVRLDHHRRVLEPLGGLELALGGDHLRAPLALGLGLPRHRALHVAGDLDVLDLDDRDLDAPRRGLLVDDPLQDRVDLLALGEQLVERVLAEHGAQRRLRDLRGRGHVVLDLNDRGLRLDDAEVRDGVHAHGHVVAGDHVLRRHVERDRPQVDLDHLVDDRDQDEDARPLRMSEQPAERGRRSRARTRGRP